MSHLLRSALDGIKLGISDSTFVGYWLGNALMEGTTLGSKLGLELSEGD